MDFSRSKWRVFLAGVWTVVAFALLILVAFNYRKQLESGSAGAPKPTLTDYAGEWGDQWHHLTIEPDGRGYGSAEFGADFDSGEVRVHENEYSTWVTVPHLEGTRAVPRAYLARLKDDSLELRDSDGRMFYTLKKLFSRPPAKLSDLAGNWEVKSRVTQGSKTEPDPEDDSFFRLYQRSFSLGTDGRGTWKQKEGDGTGAFTVRERDGQFQCDELEGKAWRVTLFHIGRDGAVLRFQTPDGTIRLYLRKLAK
jgi:hypothetical protein